MNTKKLWEKQMEFSAYLKELGLDEIIADLHNFEDSANDNQKEAIQTMIVAYESAIDGSEDYKALEETLQFTIDKRFSNNQKIDNVIRKHALVSMLILLELSRQGKADFKKWLESIVVSTRTVIDGDEFEEVTTININNDDDSAEEKALAEVTFEEDFLDIPLANRLAGKKWLDENAPNNPKWSGYIGKKSLVEQLENIESFDKDAKIQSFTNISNTRKRMKMLNTLISKRFELVLNGYREKLGVSPILRKNMKFGADEVAYFSELIDNNNEEIVASSGKSVTIDYFADNLFYHLTKDRSDFTEKAKSFMLNIFITEIKHIKTDTEDRYVMTYHYELKEE